MKIAGVRMDDNLLFLNMLYWYVLVSSFFLGWEGPLSLSFCYLLSILGIYSYCI